jgi:hypothetical protein
MFGAPECLMVITTIIDQKQWLNALNTSKLNMCELNIEWRKMKNRVGRGALSLVSLWLLVWFLEVRRIFRENGGIVHRSSTAG